MAVNFRHGRMRARAGCFLSRLCRLLSNSLGGTVLVTSNACGTAGQQNSAKPKRLAAPGDRDFEAARQRGARSGLPRRSGNCNLLSTVSSSAEGVHAATLYAYHPDGTPFLTALDLNTNGVIDLDGPDRVTGTSTVYEYGSALGEANHSLGEGWWRVSRQWVYPEFDSASAVTTSVQRVLLTGLGVQQGDDGILVSYSETLDVRGNATVSEVFIDRAARTVTQVTLSPTSVQPEIQTAVNGLLTQTVSSTAVTNTYAYDGLARQTAVTDGRGNATITGYTPLGLIAYTEDAATNRTTYDYDFLGRRTSVTDALTNTTYTAYDEDNRVTAQWGATYPVRYEYDAHGRMIAMRTYRSMGIPAHEPPPSNGGDLTQWLYDQPTGLLTNKLYADGLGPSYTYTPDGKLATRLWASGISTSYAYDAAGALVVVDYSDDTPDIAYTYDRIGNMASVTDASGTRMFSRTLDGLTLTDAIQFQNEVFTLHESYDAFGRGAGYALSNTVDGASSLITSVALEHDPYGRLSVCSVGNIPAPFRYGWLPNSNLQQSLAMPNGVTRQTTYDPHRDLLASITHTNAAGVILTHRTFTRDAADRLTNRTQYRLGDEANRLDTFDYNPRSELTSAALGTNDYAYAFDPIGNRQTAEEPDFSATYGANSLNQYTNISYGQTSVFAPVFDFDGNQTLLKTTTGIWHVRYNGENRPVCFSNDTAVVDMDYDDMGRRFFYRETVSNTVTRHERHLYRDYLRIAALGMLNTNAVIHSVVWDPTEPVATRPLLLATPSGWHTYGFDQVKNVTDLFDSSGTLSGIYDYASFGALTLVSGQSVGINPLAFSSEIWDATVGLVCFNYRHLIVSDGRWVGRDPIEKKGASHLYRMVDNQTTRMVDVLGLESDASICARAKEKLKIGDSGWVICHCGNLIACASDGEIPELTDPKAKELAVECVKKHETEHIEDLTCNRLDDIAEPDWKYPFPGNKVESECKAIKTHINCLEDAMTACGDNTQCVDEIKDEKSQRESRYNGLNCGNRSDWPPEYWELPIGRRMSTR
jgi:RHS repeat-associated protein